jgi:hypothetical protein
MSKNLCRPFRDARIPALPRTAPEVGPLPSPTIRLLGRSDFAFTYDDIGFSFLAILPLLPKQKATRRRLLWNLAKTPSLRFRRPA